MLKKLLVAVLALTMMIGLFSSALAANSKLVSRAVPVDEMESFNRGERTSPGCTDWFYNSYWDNTYYIWTFPDVDNGTTYPNTRFTNSVAMELGMVEFILRRTSSSVNVGMTMYIWNSDADGFPDMVNPVIYSAPLNPINWPVWPWSPSGRTAYVDFNIPDMPAFIGNYNVGFSPILNDPSDYLSIYTGSGDPATMAYWGVDGEGRASSNYDGTFYSNLDLYGADYSWSIDVYTCAVPPPPCGNVANPTDQWPIWCHDFGRTSQSGITLGTDICGLQRAWVYDLGYVGGAYHQIARTSPLIVDDKVYVIYTDRVVCLNLLTGLPIWSSFDLPYAGAFSTLLSNPAIVDGYLYMGTGAAVAPGAFPGNPGFIKIDAATGAMVWVRGASFGTPLESGSGATQCSPPVIIGDVVFFGNQAGVVYALNKNTGATLGYTTLTVTPSSTVTAKMMGSISSDGTNLFIGTANVTTVPPALGCVYSLAFDGAAFSQNWVYLQPAAVIATWPGGFFSAPSVRCDHLFINSIATYNSATGYCGYRQDLDPATGAQKWFADMGMGGARQSPPATYGTDAGPVAVFANYNTSGYQGSGYSRGVRAVNTYNNTVWANPGGANWENQVYVHASVTQDPWVFYGANDTYAQNAYNPYGGNWTITDANTGAIAIQYALTGYIDGTAIAHGSDGDYVVVTTQFSNNAPANGGGLVIAFKNQGLRPRLVVPLRYFAFASTNDAEAGPLMKVQRTAVGAIENSGCADLTWTGVLDDGVVAKIRTVSSASEQKAADLAANLIDRTVDDLTAFNEPSKSKLLVHSLLQNEEGDWYMPASQVKPAAANSAALATPDWVVWADPVSGSGTVAAGAAGDFTFEFDLTKMNKLGVNNFYVVLSTNDPDFNAEIPPTTPQGAQIDILYSMPYMYCGITIETMYFGDDGIAWANNIGLLGDADYADEFAPSGAGDIMFAGTMFYANDMNSAAWNPVAGDGSWEALVDGGFLYGFYPSGDDCGGCVIDQPLPVAYTINGGLNYTWIQGDICTFAWVDSGQDMGYYEYQDGPSMGILVKSREVGAYGPDFAEFKLTVQTIINRNATPVNGLYYGAFVDWDVSGADEGMGDAEKGYIFQYGGGAAYGFIGLPSKGSYFTDGTKTDPMYNGQILHSADDYWDNEQFDSLYAWIDQNPEGNINIRPVETAGTDRAMELAFGKCDLGDHGEHTFGFATFGFDAYSAPSEVENLRKFVNKFAGFGRGDIDNNDVIDLRDLVRLVRFVSAGGPGPVPFRHLGDVNCDGLVDLADCTMLKAYFFTGGTPPKSAFMF